MSTFVTIDLVLCKLGITRYIFYRKDMETFNGACLYPYQEFLAEFICISEKIKQYVPNRRNDDILNVIRA